MPTSTRRVIPVRYVIPVQHAEPTYYAHINEHSEYGGIYQIQFKRYPAKRIQLPEWQ